MIDIHCHILPGIDDGPSDIHTSMEMIRIAAADGITHCVATPHYRCSAKVTKDEISRSVDLLNARIQQEGLPVTLLCGADIKLTYEVMKSIERNDIPTIHNSRYFLLELPDPIPPHLESLFFAAGLKGLVPIITHPERNASLLTSPGKIQGLRDSGALLQLTAMSITGEFGPQVRSFSRMLLKKEFIDFIASDAHDTRFRAPVLSAAFKEVSGIMDGQKTRKIFFENPSAVLENREIMVD